MNGSKLQCPECFTKLVHLHDKKYRCPSCWRVVALQDAELLGQEHMPFATQSQSEHGIEEL